MAATTAAARPKLDVAVNKPTPYTFDLGLLLANDPNPLNTSSPDPAAPLEERLAAVARDGAQALINQLLTTAPLQSTTDGVLLTLPPPTTALPREKPLPAAKEATRWEKFAARKGIKPKTREQRAARGREFNEATGQWERTWGHDRGGRLTDRKRARDEGAVQKDWLVEVDEQAEAEAKREKALLKGARARGAAGTRKASGGGGGAGGKSKRR
ncbi:Rhodanese-related sulfurtransferase [Diatrype stigma]|uniref:Ribosome biogenesis regulatory protein n=1 Tax=Diatrype stigma TaxID=117547 RepID=A0AAN9UJL0_9PEZI